MDLFNETFELSINLTQDALQFSKNAASLSKKLAQLEPVKAAKHLTYVLSWLTQLKDHLATLSALLTDQPVPKLANYKDLAKQLNDQLAAEEKSSEKDWMFG